VSYFAELQELACTAEQLQAEEYEASVEMEVLRGTLQSLSVRTAEARHLRLAFHSKAGARAAGETLGVDNLHELTAALAEAQKLAEAADPLIREESVLRSRLSKLEGKVKAINMLKVSVRAGMPVTTIRREAEAMRHASRLAHLRVTVELADLRLLMMSHEKAQANVHASGGAIVCIKKLQLALDKTAVQPAQPPPPPPKLIVPGSGESSGPLTEEMRAFLRGCFAPMLRAAMTQLILRHPPDPFRFLADWFWQHSAHYRFQSDGRAYLTSRDVELRRKAIAAAKADLERTIRAIGHTLDSPQQALGASRMLQALDMRLLTFPEIGEVSASDPSSAWSVNHPKPQLAFENASLLDAVSSIMTFYPRVMLQIHMPPPAATHLPAHLASALRIPASAAATASNADVEPLTRPGPLTETEVRDGRLRLARLRSEAALNALVIRGVPAQRMVATAPGCDLGLQASGQFTAHELPDALTPPAGLPHPLAPEAAAALGGRREQEGTHVKASHDALAILRRRREVALEDARLELAQLQDYAARLPFLALPRAVTIVISVIDLSLPSSNFPSNHPDADLIHPSINRSIDLVNLSIGPSTHPSIGQSGLRGLRPPTVSIAFGAERVSARLAAFEACDLAVDEAEIEVWQDDAPPIGDGRGGTGGGSSGADGGESWGAMARLLGACTVGVGGLLIGEQAELSAALPLLASAGRVVGTVRLRIERRREG